MSKCVKYKKCKINAKIKVYIGNYLAGSIYKKVSKAEKYIYVFDSYKTWYYEDELLEISEKLNKLNKKDKK